MSFNINTPALLFPAITLLLLAYTNRFLAVATLVRNLHAKYLEKPGTLIEGQIMNLRRRLSYIKYMQGFGILSFCVCVASIFAVYVDLQPLGYSFFGLSLGLLMTSLIISLLEIQISTNALNLELSDMEEKKQTQ